MKTYKLHLIRHGLTDGNTQGIFVGGGLDIPVSEEGARQLHALKEQYQYPGVPLVFSSPMQRAIQTAEILYPDVPEKIVVEDLRENLFGEFEGKSVKDMIHEPHFTEWLNPESHYTPAGGESGETFAARTVRALSSMMTHLARHGIGQAACIAHGGVFMSILSQCGVPKKSPLQWMTDNGCGFTVQADAAQIMRDGLVEVVEILPLGYTPQDPMKRYRERQHEN